MEKSSRTLFETDGVVFAESTLWIAMVTFMLHETMSRKARKGPQSMSVFVPGMYVPAFQPESP